MLKFPHLGLVLFAACLSVQWCFAGSNVIFCYWSTWSTFRQGNGEFKVNNINPHLCTHIGYAFLGLGDNDQIKALQPQLDFDSGNIARTIALKKINPQLKVMASVGGGSEGSAKYSAMASSAQRRSTFVVSVVQFLQQHGFDGLDLDWEFPAQHGGSSDDRNNFVKLLSELKTALKLHGLLLTIAVAGGQWSANISYDIPNVARHVDLINVMTYDFAGPWRSTLGFNAPLAGQEKDNVKAGISYWLQSGAPANKLVMGLAFYGRSFTLANTAQTSPGAPILGGGNPGPITHETGVLAYYEICEYLKTSNWKRHFDTTYGVPFAINGNQWVGYDDEESLSEKIRYLKSLNLAGAMVWSIDFDDFLGTCGKRYPLLNKVNNDLQ